MIDPVLQTPDLGQVTREAVIFVAVTCGAWTVVEAVVRLLVRLAREGKQYQ